jgi:hypothetical protein
MHTLDQLRRGDLAGITRLDLSANLSEFPEEIFALADSLEVLNLSGNQLTRLPADLSRLHNLRILFCSDNPITEVPDVLGDCPHLEMVGFKSCRIEQVPAASLPQRLRWLILTDNRVRHLPDELGNCSGLQKLMLAGNQLTALPQGLADCQRLELLRMAANRFETLPPWLLELPRLCWLAFAGNPCVGSRETAALGTAISRAEITLGEVLGQGASGIIHAAEWRHAGQPMAVKLFKGQMTSDGLPDSEMAACLQAGEHANLIRVAGPLETLPGDLPGLLLERIDASYQTLAGPPSLSSCTRDCYAEDRRFTVASALSIARGAAAAVAHLHGRGILHGDFYAHNLLVDTHGRCLLGDLGAASFFDPHSQSGQRLQRIEARAFGNLLEELLQRCAQDDRPQAQAALHELHAQCTHELVTQRPAFSEINEVLEAISP